MSRVTLKSPAELQALYDKLEGIEKLLRNQKLVTDDPILTTQDVMKYLNVSRRCLQGWRDNAILEFAAVQGKFYYKMSKINYMIDKHSKKIED